MFPRGTSVPRVLFTIFLIIWLTHYLQNPNYLYFDVPALRPYRPRGKEAAAAAPFPLGGGLVWRSLQTRLSFELGLSQFSIPRLTLHQMSEGGHWDTDMCVDLACCFDTLEQDLIILLRTTTTCYCLLS